MFNTLVILDFCEMFMSHLQTRPGLQIIRDNFMAACEVSPWADKDLVRHTLLEESSVIIPIFAIRYHWLTSGRFKYKQLPNYNHYVQLMLSHLWTFQLGQDSRHK